MNALSGLMRHQYWQEKDTIGAIARFKLGSAFAKKADAVKAEEQTEEFTIGILTEQRKIAQMYLDVTTICRSLLDEALLNPKDISASMLNVVMRWWGDED